jgi:hypothetical protein
MKKFENTNIARLELENRLIFIREPSDGIKIYTNTFLVKCYLF